MEWLLDILWAISEFEITLWGSFAFYAIFSMGFTTVYAFKYILKSSKKEKNLPLDK